MRPVFVDTGGWYASFVSKDADHAAGTAIFRRLRAQRRQLVTTDAVLFEAYALFLNRANNGKNLARALLDEVKYGGLTMIHLTEEDVARSIDLVRAHGDKSYSLCDASSFVVMERLRIRDVIAFDDHFRQFGRFSVLE